MLSLLRHQTWSTKTLHYFKGNDDRIYVSINNMMNSRYNILDETEID